MIVVMGGCGYSWMIVVVDVDVDDCGCLSMWMIMDVCGYG